MYRVRLLYDSAQRNQPIQRLIARLHDHRMALVYRSPNPGAVPNDKSGRTNVLYTIAIILIVLWVLGLVTSYTLGGFIHVLLVIAIVVILIRVIQGRRL